MMSGVLIEIPSRRWEDSIRMNFDYGIDLVHITQNRV